MTAQAELERLELQFRKGLITGEEYDAACLFWFTPENAQKRKFTPQWKPGLRCGTSRETAGKAQPSGQQLMVLLCRGYKLSGGKPPAFCDTARFARGQQNWVSRRIRRFRIELIRHCAGNPAGTRAVLLTQNIVSSVSHADFVGTNWTRPLSVVRTVHGKNASRGNTMSSKTDTKLTLRPSWRCHAGALHTLQGQRRETVQCHHQGQRCGHGKMHMAFKVTASLKRELRQHVAREGNAPDMTESKFFHPVRRRDVPARVNSSPRFSTRSFSLGRNRSSPKPSLTPPASTAWKRRPAS